MTIDIKYHYLGTPTNRYEYMCFPVKDIPQDTRKQYNIYNLIVSGHILLEIPQDMYDLYQSHSLYKNS